ncbi:hypothetical protein OUZ56_020018 [Daphnia magna]|uniref:Uncharacterized protein n=1 Tax=Daphnia magna TaxID=35525 RepID=A0ABQ9ZDA5_9CRUS|nr:hypothetical protein OUZ56_020018 [Daphnia magna]
MAIAGGTFIFELLVSGQRDPRRRDVVSGLFNGHHHLVQQLRPLRVYICESLRLGLLTNVSESLLLAGLLLSEASKGKEEFFFLVLHDDDYIFPNWKEEMEWEEGCTICVVRDEKKKNGEGAVGLGPREMTALGTDEEEEKTSLYGVGGGGYRFLFGLFTSSLCMFDDVRFTVNPHPAKIKSIRDVYHTMARDTQKFFLSCPFSVFLYCTTDEKKKSQPRISIQELFCQMKRMTSQEEIYYHGALLCSLVCVNVIVTEPGGGGM